VGRMRGADNRVPNVIATVFVVWLVGVCVACTVGVVLVNVLGPHLGPPVGVLAALAILLGPIIFSIWWNYRRRTGPTGPPQPWQ
jgi:hypothetical protein